MKENIGFIVALVLMFTILGWSIFYTPSKTVNFHDNNNIVCVERKGWGFAGSTDRCYNYYPLNEYSE